MSGLMMLMCFPRSSLELHIFPQPPHWWQVWVGDILFLQLRQKMFTAVSLREDSPRGEVEELSALTGDKSWSLFSLCSARFRDCSSPRRFSGNCKSSCRFPLWTFKPRFDLEENSHWSHLNCSSLGPGLWLGWDVKRWWCCSSLLQHKAAWWQSPFLHQALVVGKESLQSFLLTCLLPRLFWGRQRWMGKTGSWLQRSSDFPFVVLQHERALFPLFDHLLPAWEEWGIHKGQSHTTWLHTRHFHLQRLPEIIRFCVWVFACILFSAKDS